MDARLMFPNEWIAAADLRGKPVVLTISHVSMEDLHVEGGGKERKPVVQFAEMEARPKDKRKRFVLNKTNMKSIAKLYGFETDAWIGQRITLYPTTCRAFGDDNVDCVRVRGPE